jgi:photosynthetic reaction center H subunit
MLAGIGPGAWAEREDAPERSLEGEPNIVPLRAAPGFYVEPRDPDPRGMEVVAADNRVAGVVTELWVDRAEPQIRYLEVELTGTAPAAASPPPPLETTAEGEPVVEPAPAAAPPAPTVLLPIHFARISAGRRQVRVRAILARHFADVPRLAAPDLVTKREEDRIAAYYAAGHRYALPARAEPLL